MDELWYTNTMQHCVAMRMNKQTPTTYNNMDEFHRHVEWKKSDTKENTLYKTINAKYKNRQTCAVKRQIRSYCWGEVTGRAFKGGPGCWSCCFLIWHRCVHFGETLSCKLMYDWMIGALFYMCILFYIYIYTHTHIHAHININNLSIHQWVTSYINYEMGYLLNGILCSH